MCIRDRSRTARTARRSTPRARARPARARVEHVVVRGRAVIEGRARDHQQARVDLALPLQQIDVEIALAQLQVAGRDAGRDGQLLAGQRGGGARLTGLARLELTPRGAPQVGLPAGAARQRHRVSHAAELLGQQRTGGPGKARRRRVLPARARRVEAERRPQAGPVRRHRGSGQAPRRLRRGNGGIGAQRVVDQPRQHRIVVIVPPAARHRLQWIGRRAPPLRAGLPELRGHGQRRAMVVRARRAAGPQQRGRRRGGDHGKRAAARGRTKTVKGNHEACLRVRWRRDARSNQR